MSPTSCSIRKCDRKKLVRAFLCCSAFLVVLLALNGQIFTRIHKSTHFKITFNHQKTDRSVKKEEVKVDDIQYDADKPEARRYSEFGYILASHYSDQMTGASLNLLSLQCWASTVSQKLRVVEPFLLPGGSKFGVTLAAKKQQDTPESATVNSVKLRDMLDIDSWEEETNKMGYTPLISWNQFLKLAPPNLIAVRRRCVDDKSWKCRYSEMKFNSSVVEFSKSHRFRVVQFVYVQQRTYSSMEFRNLIYGKHNVSSTIVLFNNWGGIYSSPEPRSFRIGIPEAKGCHRHSFVSFPFRLSQQIQQDSEQYLERYLPGAKEQGYVSVMFRSERFALRHGFPHITSMEQKTSLLANCVKGISTHVNNLKRQFGMEAVFLAMDCRKQGSKIFRRQTGPGYTMNKDLFDKVAFTLFQSLFGNNSSLKKWDESFDAISTFKSAGYLAQLQKYLAARGTCLLTAGGGGFQQSTIKLYNESHWQSLHCAMEIPQC